MVVPNPAPMSYGVVATSATAVNAVKRRPLGQNVAVSMHDEAEWRSVSASFDLSVHARTAVRALLCSRFTVLVTLKPQPVMPAWVEPAVRDNQLAMFNGYWSLTGAVWKKFPRLFGSSANITGERPAGDAEQAAAMFGTSCPIIDVDEGGLAVTGRWASTMIRIDRSDCLELARSGAQDRVSGLPPKEFAIGLAVQMGLTSANGSPRVRLRKRE